MEYLDLAEVCRVCLTKHKDMYLALDVGVVDRLLDCASVQLPPESLVCEFCKSEVDKWYSFKQQVLKSVEVAQYISDYNNRREKPAVKKHAVIEEYFVKIEPEDEVEYVEVKPEPALESEDPLNIEQNEEVAIPPETSAKVIYNCDICEKVLSSSSALFYHKNNHTRFFKPNTPPPQEEHSDSPCLSPPPKFNNKTEDDKKYQCDLCHKTFISKNGIVWHKQIHSALKLGLSKVAERFPCPCCPMVYEKKSSLLDHVKWKHNRTLKKVKYGDSKPKYDYKVNLRSRKSEKQKPYNCDSCKKSFTKLGNWTAHHRFYCKDNLFSCDDKLKHASERREKSSTV